MTTAERTTEARNKEIVWAGFDRWAEGIGSLFDDLAADATWTRSHAVSAGAFAGSVQDESQDARYRCKG